MRRVEALFRALDEQVAVGALIEQSDLELESSCPGWSVRDVLNHSVGVTLKFAEFAAGRTDSPRDGPHDHLGLDHRHALGVAAATARSSWRSADMSRICHLPFGDFPADAAAGINLFDVLAHTWDVAVATGVAMDGSDLWQDGLEAAVLVLGPRRDARHYGPEVAVPPTVPARTRFLAYLGRRDPFA